MLNADQKLQVCGSLISSMLPEDCDTRFGFSTNPNERVWLANTPQTPRPEVETIAYFSFRDNLWRNAVRSDVKRYDQNDATQIIEQMRVLRIIVDIYSKKQPIGYANDALRWIMACLSSDAFGEWNAQFNNSFAYEKVWYAPDLTPLLQAQTWAERQQATIFLNFRDSIELPKPYITTKINLNAELKSPYY